jgi:hypothetical protein
MKWASRVRLRAKHSDMVMTLHGYLWRLRIAGALWEWRQL